LPKKLKGSLVNWIIFLILSIIWGSSFLLMIKGLTQLNAYQVASLRIVFSGLVLLPIALKHFRTIPTKKISIIFLSGLLGSLLPAFLFCLAETKIDSSLAGSLNALTPVFVILMGFLFFKVKTSSNKTWGIIISFLGSVLLFLSQPVVSNNNNILFVGLVIIATMLYGINVNMVNKYLSSVPSLHIAAVALSLNAIPALFVLFFVKGYDGNTFFQFNFSDVALQKAIGYTFILGVLGTAVASIIFYKLMKSAGMIFASMVTYAIPLVAVLMGVFFLNENVGWKQVACLAVILTGVYLANRTQKDTD
jgi:drug/metabolite transporter (DMT)-like permease